jgi:hypothetical protein
VRALLLFAEFHVYEYSNLGKHGLEV